MSIDRLFIAPTPTGERAWRIAAAVVLVAFLVLLGAFGAIGYGASGLGASTAATGRSLADIVRAPSRNGPPPLPRDWRHTGADTVIFYTGFFCAEGPGSKRVRLILSLRELDTLTRGTSRVVGPFSDLDTAKAAC